MGSCMLFSGCNTRRRSLQDLSTQYPEVVSEAQEAAKTWDGRVR